MRISVIEPLNVAIEKTKQILIGPFDLKKWLVLALCAFIAQCGEGGGGSGNFSNISDVISEAGPSNMNEASAFFAAYMMIILAISAVILCFALTIYLLTTWLSSRGKFMLIDGIVHNRAEVSKPWAEYASEGNSLFKFRVVTDFIIIVGLAIIIVVPLFLFGFSMGSLGGAESLLLIVGIAGMVILALIPLTIFSYIIRNFVVPAMYKKRISAMEALSLVWTEIISPHLGKFLLSILLLKAVGIAVGIASIIIMLLTCCCAALPYVSNVVLLPFTVFFVCYSLAYIEQFGEEWTFFGPQGEPDQLEDRQ